MNNDNSFENDRLIVSDREDSSDPGRKGQKIRRSVWMLLAAPIITCLGCIALVVVFFVPMDERTAGPQIPVTGGEADILETPSGQEESQPVPGSEYRGEVERILATCYVAFHQIFLYEEMAANEPGISTSAQWREEAGKAIDSFRQDCGELSNLPSAPLSYTEVDQWLDLAAAEVLPAAESFTKALDVQPAESIQREDLRQFVEHIHNFAEYTHNAEIALSNLDERKEI